MPNKSKPKPRTNWKQRALHCEEVIRIQNELAESRENKHAALLLRAEELRKKLCETMDYGIELDKQVELEVKLRDEYWNRALAAEKHNALLLEERDQMKANMFTITSYSDGIKLGFHEENGEMVFDEHNFASDDEARAAANQIFPAWTQEAVGIDEAHKLFEIGDVVETPHGTFTIGDPQNLPKVEPAPTHWQRFKSFLTNWQVELLTVAAVVTVLSAYVAFIYRNGVR